MITPEENESFKACGALNVIAQSHDADWAEIKDVHNVAQVVSGQVVEEYMLVDWMAQNGHLIRGFCKIHEGYRAGFNENQISVLGLAALARDKKVVSIF
ncbi:MAG TPA: hypothetical protein VLG25_03415 [Patescibacteria group bacterium]|nr:hypothetical protein [Patescibacteria group bacterium]